LKRNGLVFLAEEKFAAGSETFREICVQVHDHLAAHTMGPTEKPDHQIERLACWRAGIHLA
jgi:hypothetical protein